MKITATTTSATIAFTAPGIDRRRLGGGGVGVAGGVGAAGVGVGAASPFAAAVSSAGTSALIGRFGLTARKLLGFAGWPVR